MCARKTISLFINFMEENAEKVAPTDANPYQLVEEVPNRDQK